MNSDHRSNLGELKLISLEKQFSGFLPETNLKDFQFVL